ncbi:MAG: HlyC/CorC family transporter [Clostridia bacterium]|nr:HlyC/CorC family transporter [Clostridia bacterium]
MDNTARQIAVLVILILFSAYFSATETAFSSLNRIKLKNKAKSGNKRAEKTLKLCDEYDKLLSTILIGNNVVNILSASIATALFVFYFPQKGVAYSTITMTAIVLIFGEILPKSIAKEIPESFAMFSEPFISFFLAILTPVTFIFSVMKKGIDRAFKIRSDKKITDSELLTIVEEAKSEGSIDEDEGHLLKSAIEFYDLEVSDILTPRVDVVSADIESSPDEIRDIFKKSGFSRLPVYKDTVDNIVGIINEKDFFYKGNISEIMLPAVRVLETMKISKLVSLLREKKQHLAVVTDEYGGTVGVVSLEDALEELVGEIWDEHDSVKMDFIKISDHRYRISGNANIDKMFEIFGVTPKNEFDSTSVTGWITETLGHIPKRGERFEAEGIFITVLRTNQNRVSDILAVKKSMPQTGEK